MRDYELELKKRVAFIQNVLSDANADGIVYGNSGGKTARLLAYYARKHAQIPSV